MSSKYDTIKTAADLVREVQNHGLSTDQEDICRAQDIFGNSSIKELARLANDNGRNNDQGEADPKGSWSSGRKPTQGTFYMIAFSIWNWEDATRFWNLHTNPEHEALKSVREIMKKLQADVIEMDSNNKKLKELHDDLIERYDRIEGEYFSMKYRAEAAEAEVVALKAKLYDHITKEEKK